MRLPSATSRLDGDPSDPPAGRLPDRRGLRTADIAAHNSVPEHSSSRVRASPPLMERLAPPASSSTPRRRTAPAAACGHVLNSHARLFPWNRYVSGPHHLQVPIWTKRRWRQAAVRTESARGRCAGRVPFGSRQITATKLQLKPYRAVPAVTLSILRTCTAMAHRPAYESIGRP